MLHAYADDSSTSTHAVYAAFVAPDTLCDLAVTHLDDFKTSLGVSANAELHCQVLFHSSKRESSAWKHVRIQDAEEALYVLCKQLRSISSNPASVSVPFDGAAAPPVNPKNRIGISGPKGVATIGYMALHQSLIDRVGPKGVRLWLDVDDTRIPWLGGRRKAHLTREFFAALQGPSTSLLAHPDRERPPHPKLFELADLYAYALVNRERGTRQAFFRQLCQVVGLQPGGALFIAEPEWQSGPPPRTIGQTMWRLQKDGKIARALFEPFGEGFVWVEVHDGIEPVMHEQRLCEHPNEVEAVLQAFRDEYLSAGWTEVLDD